MARRVTIKQIAAQTGVSFQTVSKVLNRKARVSQETEERIWEVARRLGYRPNQVARSLRSQRTNLLGYAWPSSLTERGNPILDQFLQSILCVAQDAGYNLLCFPDIVDADPLKLYQELIDTNQVDGFIVSGVEYDDRRIAYLLENEVPFVAFGRSNPGWEFPCVDVDGAEGMRALVGHLVKMGHSQIAALAWFEDSRVGNNRMEGYRTALNRAGIPLPVDWIARGQGSYRFGYKTALLWLNRPAGQRPTAIVAFNNVMAVGAIHAALELGLQVGIDLAVTGFDGLPVARFTTPPLTTVLHPTELIGREIITMLVDILNGLGRNAGPKLLSPELVVRESSDFKLGATS